LSIPLQKEKTSFFDVFLTFALFFSYAFLHQPKKSGTREPKDGPLIVTNFFIFSIFSFLLQRQDLLPYVIISKKCRKRQDIIEAGPRRIRSSRSPLFLKGGPGRTLFHLKISVASPGLHPGSFLLTAY